MGEIQLFSNKIELNLCGVFSAPNTLKKSVKQNERKLLFLFSVNDVSVLFLCHDCHSFHIFSLAMKITIGQSFKENPKCIFFSFQSDQLVLCIRVYLELQMLV
jgi:hypothetical protein